MCRRRSAAPARSTSHRPHTPATTATCRCRHSADRSCAHRATPARSHTAVLNHSVSRNPTAATVSSVPRQRAERYSPETSADAVVRCLHFDELRGSTLMRLGRFAAVAGCSLALVLAACGDDSGDNGQRQRQRRGGGAGTAAAAAAPAATASSASPGTTTRKSAGRSSTSRRSRRRSRPAAARTSRTTPSRRQRRRPATSRT